MLKLGILLIDDDPDLLAASKDYLERAGYRVLTAKNAAEALQLCRTEVIHLAVIDIRLKDNADESDVSGLQLAADLSTHIFKVILTGGRYPNPEDLVRDTLEPDDQGKVLAAKFLWKKEGHKKVLETIQRAFRTNIKVNPVLKIKMPKETSWRVLVDRLTMFRDLDEGVKQKAEQVLLDLTCRLFHESDEVRFWRIAPGFSSCAVAIVQPFINDVPGTGLVVKFGPCESIFCEETNYQTYIKPHLTTGATLFADSVCSREMGAIAYAFAGEYVMAVKDFSSYYNSEDVTNKEIRESLGHLFQQTCGNWYQGIRAPEEAERMKLDRWYREALNLIDKVHVEEHNSQVSQLIHDTPSSQIKLRLVEHDLLQVQIADEVPYQLPHPPHFALEKYSSEAGGNFFPVPSQVAITHGDMRGSNILVGEKGRTWPIDFFKTGWGPVFRDFAQLESDIKFDLLSTSDLRQRYDLERVLIAQRRLDEPLDFGSNASATQIRALAAIQTLRELACQLTDTESPHEYFISLLFFALKRMGDPTLDGNKEGNSHSAPYHALLSAALICQRLQQDAQSHKDLRTDVEAFLEE